MDASSVEVAAAQLPDLGVDASLGVADFLKVKPSRLC